MSDLSILQLVLGPLGVLVVLSVVVVLLYRENQGYKKQIREMQEDRLKDAKDAEMLANAYLKLRQQDRDVS